MKSTNSKINQNIDSPKNKLIESKIFQSSQNLEETDFSKNILNINKKLVDDLDSIYFLDKVNMRSSSNKNKNVNISLIPKLDFNFATKNVYNFI